MEKQTKSKSYSLYSTFCNVNIICSYFCLKKEKHCREFKVLTFIVASVVLRDLALDRLKYHIKYQHSADLIKEHHALRKNTN